MVIDIFCPDLNVQAALSFMATMWMVSLTRVTSGDVKEYYYAPLTYGSASSGCEMTLQAYPNVADGQALYITMATRYNESFTDDTNLTLMSSMMYRSHPIISHVHRFTSDARPNMQIFSDKGDPMYIPSSNQQATDYLLLLDDASQHEGGQGVYVVGMNDNTTVNVYMNTNTSSYASMEMVASMQINNYDTVLLNSTFTKDGVRLNSSQCFGVVIISDDIGKQCNFSTDSTWERLPSKSFMGQEFHIMSPSNQTVYICKFIGSEKGNLSINSDGNTTVYDIVPYTSLSVNLTGQLEVVVSSSGPIQTLCTTWVQQQTPFEQLVYRNQYLPLPVDLMSGCNVAVVQNCENSTCILAMSASATEELDIRQSNEKSKTSISCDRTTLLGDKEYHIWDIQNLTDGVYVIQTRDNAPLMVFVLDLSTGRFFPLECSTCNASMDLQSSQVTSGIKPAAIDSAQSLTANLTGDPGVALLSNTTEVNSNGTSNTSSINSTPVSSTVKSTTPPPTKHVVVVSKYTFMYDEISDDDRILNEYMIAVIVSLGTAIFAVIAVLSTFLLLEVLSRRRQLGNSKIRPMVS